MLSTLGSLGDLHPFIAIGLRLKARGYEPIIAASPDFRGHATSEGLAFHPVGPARAEVLQHLGMDVAELGRRVMKDTLFILEAGCFPYIRSMYDDLVPVIDGAALVLNSTLMYSARFAAEKLGVPQMAVALQPLVFLSSYDPPAVDQMPWLAPVLAKLGPAVTRAVYGLGKKAAARRGEPLYAFRRELGLPETEPNPMFEGQFSSLGTLATYSPVLGAVQPDFPPRTTITGFTFYDQATRQRSVLASDLQKFLADGPPPLVFTLGSFAVGFPGDFYRVSRDVARQLGQRAVLLVGEEGVDAYRDVRSDEVFVCDYAPFSELFSKARAIVHHGGVGTLGQALRAGKPQLVVPLFSDQFDNAARAVRLGVARSVRLTKYAPGRVTAALSALINDASYGSRAAAVGSEVSREQGDEVAARVIDSVLSARLKRTG